MKRQLMFPPLNVHKKKTNIAFSIAGNGFFAKLIDCIALCALPFARHSQTVFFETKITTQANMRFLHFERTLNMPGPACTCAIDSN